MRLCYIPGERTHDTYHAGTPRLGQTAHRPALASAEEREQLNRSGVYIYRSALAADDAAPLQVRGKGRATHLARSPCLLK